jgi:hypothetical protein
LGVQSDSLRTAGMGLNLPQDDALLDARGRKSGDSWKLLAECGGLSGNMSRLSLTLLLGLGVASVCRLPFLSASTFFFTRPRLFSNLLVSIDVALRRADFPGFASGLIIHQELLPVPSFCTLMKRLCNDRLCLIEFGKRKPGEVVGRWLLARQGRRRGQWDPLLVDPGAGRGGGRRGVGRDVDRGRGGGVARDPGHLAAGHLVGRRRRVAR